MAGRIVMLNGAPRAGKTSIAAAIQAQAADSWINLGVDSSMRSLPARLHPGIGLRPGGERPDLEPSVVALYAALFESVAAHARLGLDVVVDVGLHDDYSRPLGLRAVCAQRLANFSVLWVGVRCPVEVVWARRVESWGQTHTDTALVAAVERWEQAVHGYGAYDLEVDTSVVGPEEAAALILARLAVDNEESR